MIENHPLHLSKLQRDFKNAVWDGKKRNPKERPEYLKDAPPIDWQVRLGIYQYAVLERIVEAITMDFEICEKAMKKTAFRKMLLAFLNQHRPNHSSLAEISQHVPSFLKQYEETQDKLYLSELAELEWRMVKASLVEHTPLNNLEALQKEENQGKDISFLLHPAIDLLVCEYPVHRFFKRSNSAMRPARTHLCIYQKDKLGLYHVIEEEEWILLQEMKKTIRLSELNRVLDSLKLDQAILGKYFMKWSSEGIITGFQ